MTRILSIKKYGTPSTLNMFDEISKIPTFRTNITMHKYKDIEVQVNILIIDSDASLHFYAIYHKNQENFFKLISLKNIISPLAIL